MTVYEVVTARILELLDRGVIPWKQPYSAGGLLPTSYTTKKPYSGINLIMTAAYAKAYGYDCPYWITYKKCRELGGHVKKGARGVPIVYIRRDVELVLNEDGTVVDEVRRFIFRYYTAFNLEQTEGIEIPNQTRPTINTIAECEKVIADMKNAPSIIHGQFHPPSYNMVTDQIRIPPISQFKSAEYYYDVLFHELVHSTGHKSRLNREGVSTSKEELIAEIGSSYLCGYCGIVDRVIENQAAYINSWRNRIAADARLIISAAARAQAAVNYILNRKEDVVEPDAEEPAAAA